jgi:hypothetical protein
VNRLPWSEVPAGVRHAIETNLGSAVIEAVNQQGGYSPGLAARAKLADGRRVFIKAIGQERNPDTPDIFRREIGVLAKLPAAVPAPRLLSSYDDGDWVALFIEDVDGWTPAQPWNPVELRRVLEAMGTLAESLTPSPMDVPLTIAHHAENFTGWRTLAADPGRLDAGLREHVELLAGLESGWTEAAAGGSLVHGDLRADNMLLTADRVVFVDWPWASIGAPWLDALFMLPSIALHSDVPLPDVWDMYPLSSTVDPDAVNAMTAALAGYFIHTSLQPPPLNIPHVRTFQRAQGDAALAWLQTRIAGQPSRGTESRNGTSRPQ